MLSKLPSFRPEAGWSAVRLEVGRVEHPSLLGGRFGGQPVLDLIEEAPVALPLPGIAVGLELAMFPLRISQPRTITIDEDFGTRNPLFMHTGLAIILGKDELQQCHLRVRHPISIAYQSFSSSSLKHAARA